MATRKERSALNKARWAIEHPIELELRKGNQGGETKRQARKRGNKLRSIIAGGAEPYTSDPGRLAKLRAIRTRDLELRRLFRKRQREMRREIWRRNNIPGYPGA